MSNDVHEVTRHLDRIIHENYLAFLQIDNSLTRLIECIKNSKVNILDSKEVIYKSFISYLTGNKECICDLRIIGEIDGNPEIHIGILIRTTEYHFCFDTTIYTNNSHVVSELHYCETSSPDDDGIKQNIEAIPSEYLNEATTEIKKFNLLSRIKHSS